MDKGSEVEKTPRFFTRLTIGRIALTGSLFVGITCVCCGLLGVFGLYTAKLREEQRREAEQKREEGRRVSTSLLKNRLTGTVYLLDEAGREIWLRHEGVAGAIKPGINRFPITVKARWPDLAVGDKVACEVVDRGGQWLITRIDRQPEVPKKDR
jgi:hypothetical protein